MFINKKANKQKGQSLIYVSILIVILISGVFFVYDIGTMVNTKIKFQNGADAAALAAVAVKISKHHTDTLVRTSMNHESIAAQANLRAAQAVLVQLLLAVNKNIADAANLKPNPNTPGVIPTLPAAQENMPKELTAKYIGYANKTYRHVVKLHRERMALESYYAWLTGNPGTSGAGIGMIATTEAARIGLRGNVAGLLAVGNNSLLLHNTTDLWENEPKWGNLDSVAYSDEGANKKGNFGKTFIQFDGEGARSINGYTFLKYSTKYVMTTNAAAKIASSEDLKSGDTQLGALRMMWYTPRLMVIDRTKDLTLH